MKNIRAKGVSVSRLAGLFISVLAVAILLVGALSNKTTKADDLPVEHISDTLESSVAWTSDKLYVIDSTVTVPGGVTLTIQPGTIIKTNSAYDGIKVDQGGTLDAVGTSGNPIIFTALNDDSVGGDTNGDGPSNGTTSYYAAAVKDNLGTVTEQYVTTKFASTAFSLVCSGTYGSVILTDNEFKSGINFGSCPDDNITVARNHFAVDAYNPVQMDSSAVTILTMAGTDKNTFSGSDRQITVKLSFVDVPSGKTWAVDGSNGTVLEVSHIEIHGLLELNDGLIVKQEKNSDGLLVKDGGSLQIAGTSGSPVTYTSIDDDSIGGDSGGDGATTGATNDSLVGIRNSEGGNATVSHAVIKDALWAVDGCVSVADSVLYSTLGVACPDSKVTVERNTLDPSQGYAVNAQNSDVTGIALSGADKNIFAASDMQKLVYLFEDTVPSGMTWTVSDLSGEVLYPYSLDVYGALDINSGVIVKNENLLGQPSIHIYSGGSLNVNGTTSSPVIFTSMYDDSVGGDSRSDGTTSGFAGSYPRALAAEGGASVSAAHATIRYASTAAAIAGEANFSDVAVTDSNQGIEAGDNSQVVYRGNFDNIGGRAISACSWASDCVVDAAYVDWGTANGPFAINPNDNKVCGQVTVTPWVDEADSDPHLFDVLNCDNSTKLSDSVNTAASYYTTRIGQVSIDCSNGMQDACDAIHTAETCFSGARDVALSTSPWPLPPAGTTAQIAAFDNQLLDGAATYMTSQESVSVTGSLLGFFNELNKVAGTMVTMASAYDSCAPQGTWLGVGLYVIP